MEAAPPMITHGKTWKNFAITFRQAYIRFWMFFRSILLRFGFDCQSIFSANTRNVTYLCFHVDASISLPCCSSCTLSKLSLHVEPRKSKSGRTFTSFPQGILKGTWKGEITRRLPETTRETTNRRWSERLHWVDQVALFCNNIENWTFRQSIFLESVFYLFFFQPCRGLGSRGGGGWCW